MKSGSFHIQLFRHIGRLQECLFILFIFFASAVFCQSVKDISTKEGLPQSFVSGLEQDDTSFIWIGTRNGLARYDGVQFKLFQHNPHDSSTLASNLIIWIKKDKKNQLWIEHESGDIDMMNPVTEKIQHFVKGNGSGKFQFIRRGWMPADDGIFWGIRSGGGLNSYDPHGRKVEEFTHSGAGLPSDTVRGLVENKNRDIWVVSETGISLFDKKTKRFTNWKLPFKQDYGNFTGSETIAIDLHERTNGELMWGDRRSLFFFNPINHSFRTVSLPNVAYLGIRWIRTSFDGLDYFENYGKVYRYGDQTGLNSIGKTITESFGDVKSFMVDRSGLIWLGTNADGIHLIDLETPFFQSFKYKNNFCEDMMQQELGINLQQMFDWKESDGSSSQPIYFFRSAYNANRRLYLALKETVCYYDSGQRKFIRLPKVPLLPESEKLRVAIRGITMLPDGSPLVIAYNGNMMYYKSSGGKWISEIEPSLLRNKFNPLLLPLDMVTDDSTIWITTAADGLLKINIHTKEIGQLKEGVTAGFLPTNELLGICRDMFNHDLLWIGSYQGLIAFHKKTLKCDVYSIKEGLPDNTIYSILPDPLGNLWITTNKGLCRFDPISHQVRIFRTEHGLPGDEFNRFHQLRLPDGRLTFGGTEGWTIFNPLLMKNDVFEPTLALTDLRINNREVIQSREKGALRLPMNSFQQLTLPYEQNTISFSFAGLEFSQPQDLQYRYKLEGYDNDWVSAGNAHQGIYTKLPAGNYTLLVNSSNTSGKWSEHIKSLKLRIESPWYATRMAYLCYFIIVAGLAWTFIRFRVSRELLKQEMDLKERESLQLKELDDMKSKFFSNITHEFRTPLTLIMGPAEQLKAAQSKDPQQAKLAATIVNNAKQLLVLINRLMDLSKLEAKALKLYEQRGNPADTVGSIVHSFENDAETKHIELSFENKTGPMDCWFYADAIERIVYNLVSNALKFTQPGGKVDVLISLENERLHLVVQDNGIGIPEDKLPYIFDRFYQAGENIGMANEIFNQGTGIGLALVKELIDQMKADIKVVSRTMTEGPNGDFQLNQSEGKLLNTTGTVFTLNIPYRANQDKNTIPAGEYSSAFPDDETDNDTKRQRILLVEDSIELAGFIESVLSQTYQVTHVLNGELGLEAALAIMPDLILSDVMMPVMDGYELCNLLKTDIRTSHIPVILLTAKVSQENLLEGLEKGADDYLTKPFHPTELMLRIHNLFQRQQRYRDSLRREMTLPEGAFSAGEGVHEAAPHPAAEQLPQDIFLTRLYELLDENLDNSLFGVDQLVGLVNMSRSSLHRKLKTLTDMSTTEVVRNYRLKKATGFLREGYSSSDTAYKSGFGSPAYFTKSFREVYGVTPGDYIKGLRP